jgi:hypothetical protein
MNQKLVELAKSADPETQARTHLSRNASLLLSINHGGRTDLVFDGSVGWLVGRLAGQSIG